MEQCFRNPKVGIRLEDYSMCFEPLALWESNFAELGFPTRKWVISLGANFQPRISGLARINE
jgi:hypothetical protein